MAGTPTQGNRGFRYVKNLYGAQPVLDRRPLVAGVTYYTGNVLTISGTSGSARLATEADTSVYGVCVHSVGTAVAADRMLIYPLRGGNVFEARAAAGMSGGKPENYIGRVADLEIATATYHRIDTGAGTKTLIIVGYHPDDEGLATQGLRYWVTGVGTMSIADEAERH